MNHQQVPVFEMDGEDYSTPANRPGKSVMSEDDDVMELVWQDGNVVMLNQSAQNRKPQPKYDVGLPEHITAAAAPPESHQPPQIFMHENEMATWLNYPFPENVFGSDFLYSNSNPPPSTAESAAAASVVMETITVVDSNNTPLVGPGSNSGSKTDSKLDSTNASSFAAVSVSGFDGGGGVLSASISATASEREVSCETASLTSSTGGGGSTTSASGSLSAEAVWGPVDRKRKAKEREAAECQSEEVEFESGSSVKKEAGGSSSSQRSVRSRAAEVHNLSERKRRHRINEKMKSLQVMIPRCNKADKASMLDEAIEYVKTLQSQVQVMSLGRCGMVPMMFPGAHPYMPMGMEQMGMGIGMGMNRPMMPIMPYGNVLAGTPMPTPAAATAAAHMGPRFPVPAYQMPVMPPDDPNAAQATGHSDQTSISDLLGTDSQSQSLGPSSSDPYQQYPTSQQVQMQPQQNQAMAQPSSSEPSFSKGPQNREPQILQATS